jgi:hypothetical protein
LNTSQLVRRLAFVAVLGGVVDVISGIVHLSSLPQSELYLRTSDYLIEALLAAASLLQLGGLFALHLSQTGSPGYRGTGTVGFFLAAIGRAVLFVSAVGSLAAGKTDFSFFLLGALLFIIGIPLLAAATFWAGILPRWSAVLVAGLLSFAFGTFGVLLNGLCWIALGCLLLSRQAAARRETRTGP